MEKKNMDKETLLILQSRAAKANAKNLKIKLANVKKGMVI